MVNLAPGYCSEAFDVVESGKIIRWIAQIAKREKYGARRNQACL